MIEQIEAKQATDCVRTSNRIRPIDEELTNIAYERGQIGAPTMGSIMPEATGT